MCKHLKPIKVNNLEIKEFRGQRVVTFKDIDLVHGRVEGTAKSNFNSNKNRFLENEDYFIISNSLKYEIPTLEIPNRGLTVITESGYLMLVKSFTDELAWKVQRQLVNSYFRVKENLPANLNNFKNEIASLIDSKVDNKIKELDNYYKPTHSNKIHISNYIKSRLGIQKIDANYEVVKRRILILLGAKKWQDVSYETLRNNMDLVDKCIDVVKRDSPQINFFDGEDE